MAGDFDLSGLLRRIRRLADLSQRELAAAASLSPSTLAHAEAGARDLPVSSLVRAAAVAGLRLVLLDPSGEEATPMSAGAVRDHSGRRFPAHLDTRRSDEGKGLYEPRRDRPETWFTFAIDRQSRDVRRRQAGIPPDHHPAVPGDSPPERAAARRLAALRERHEDHQRRFLAGELRHIDDGWTCTCPPACEELDDRNGPPVHAPDCPCRCDVG